MHRIRSIVWTLIITTLACTVSLGAMKKTPKNMILFIDSFAHSSENESTDFRLLKKNLHENWTMDDQLNDEYKLAPLHWAVAMCRTRAVEFLLKVSGTKAYDYVCIQDDEGWTSLHWAVRWSHLEMVKLILATAGNNDEVHKILTIPNKQGKTATDFAHENNNLKILKAMHEAFLPHMLRVARPLVSTQDSEMMSEHGVTPLHNAVFSGDVRKVQYLLQHAELQEGKDTYPIISAQDDGGCTPLHWAAYLGYTDIVQHLMQVAWPESDAFTRIQSKKGWTALHMALQGASSKDNVELIECLLANIGDQSSFILLPNKDDQSAWNFAMQNGNQEIIDLLAFTLGGKTFDKKRMLFDWLSV